MNNQESAAVSPPQRGDWTSSTATSFFGRPVTLPLGWFVLALLLLLEWALFVQFANRELLGAYPRAHDQCVYLSHAYETYDHIIKDGLWAGLRRGLLMKIPQGRMIHLQTALLMLMAGPNRLAALTLNFFYFGLLQCLAVYTLLWLTRRWSVAFLGLGLLLTTRSRFPVAGGMVDFRLDHIAFCLFGVFVCLAVRSGVFASKRWSLAAGFAGALLILFRFQTALTLAASLGVLLALICLFAWQSSNTKIKRAAGQRLPGLLLAGAAISIIVLPAVWLARSELWAYYVVQAAANWTVWAQLQGISGGSGYWTFYAHSLLFDHLGSAFCALAVATPVILLSAARLRSAVREDESETDPRSPFTTLFLVVMLVVPFIILTMYPVRNPTVPNILITPAIGLVLVMVVALVPRSKRDAFPPISCTLVALSTFVLTCGIFTELAMAARRTALSGEGESIRNVQHLFDEIAVRSQKAGWATPHLAVDRSYEYLNAPLATVLAYERHHFLLEPRSLLGSGIQAVAPAAAFEAVRNSDFAIITDPSSPEASGFAFPFDVSMRQIQPQLHEAAERYLVPIGRYQVFRHHFALYVRPSVQILGDSAGWITSEGLTLVAPAATFRGRPNIELGGTTILAEYLGKMNVRAQFVTSDGKTGELPVQFNLPMLPKQAVQYKATIHLDPAQLAANGDVTVKLSFDKFFVAKAIGLNPDTRELVVMTPAYVSLLP